jgi:hypothetical protein
MFGWLFFLFGDRGILSARVEPGADSTDTSIQLTVAYQYR